MATETDKSLDDIRREVIESRNLVIKTDNLLKNLHAELKVVGKRQEDFERRQWVSSGVAYLGFLGLCVAGALVVSNVRTSAVAAERERLEKQVSDLNAKVEQQRVEAQTAQASEQRAAEVYRQLASSTGDERLRAIDAFAKIDLKTLPPFAQRALQDRVGLLRKEVGNAMLERGRAAFRRNEWGPAADELSRFLTMAPPEDEANEATLMVGQALFSQHKFDQAVGPLTRYVGGDKKLKNRDYAMLLLVQALDSTGQKDRGTEMSREALADYPNGELANGFRMRLKRVEMAAAAAGPAAPPPAGAAPAAAEPVRQPLKAPAPANPAAAPAQPKP